MLAIIAPGQGAQTPGFLSPWLESARVKDLLTWWSAVANLDLIHLGTNADADEIRDTANAQPLIVAAGLVGALSLFPHPSDAFGKVGVVAGHSVGEFTAAAGARRRHRTHSRRARGSTKMSNVVAPMSGPDSLRVYVNERGVSVPHGSVAVDAVRALFPALAADIDAGRQRLTDSRGLPVEATQALVGGSIYRVVPVRERVDAAAEPGDVEVTS